MSIETTIILILLSLISVLLVMQEISIDKKIEKHLKLRRQKIVTDLRTYRLSRVERNSGEYSSSVEKNQVNTNLDLVKKIMVNRK